MHNEGVICTEDAPSNTLWISNIGMVGPRPSRWSRSCNRQHVLVLQTETQLFNLVTKLTPLNGLKSIQYKVRLQSQCLLAELSCLVLLCFASAARGSGPCALERFCQLPPDRRRAPVRARTQTAGSKAIRLCHYSTTPSSQNGIGGMLLSFGGAILDGSHPVMAALLSG